MPDIDFWLGRKYSILQQEADATSSNAAATTSNAASNARNAGTAALTGAASAALDRVRTTILPRQADAEIALSGAQAGLLGQQTKYFGPTALANIRSVNAGTALTDTNRKVTAYEGLGDTSGLDPTVARAVALQRQSQGFSLGSIVPGRTPASSSGDALPPRKLGETQAAYLDRINGF